MQKNSQIQVFDTVELTIEHPISPDGSLFTYYPELNPSTLHYHNFLEIGYCEQGSGIFIIDGKSISFNGKCVSIIYPGQVHIAKSTNKYKSLWHFIYIDIESLFHSYPQSFLNKIKALSYENYNFPCIIHYEEDRILYDLVVSFLSEAAKAKKDYLFSLQGLLYSILVIHGRYMNEKASYEINKTKFLFGDLGKVINFINTNYMNNITIDQLTKIACISKASLQRKIFEFTGKSPMQYIIELRLNQAAIMLLDPNKRINEIAFEVGFQTLSCFNRQFQKNYKMSPSLYRKENMKI